jgi:hypothetical protein
MLLTSEYFYDTLTPAQLNMYNFLPQLKNGRFLYL